MWALTIFFLFKAVKPDPDANYIMFPRQRLGLDYDLNAVLNMHHRVTPYGDAFRNLYSRHLLMLSSGKLGTKRTPSRTQIDAQSTFTHIPSPYRTEIRPAASWDEILF